MISKVKNSGKIIFWIRVFDFIIFGLTTIIMIMKGIYSLVKKKKDKDNNKDKDKNKDKKRKW